MWRCQVCDETGLKILSNIKKMPLWHRRVKRQDLNRLKAGSKLPNSITFNVFCLWTRNQYSLSFVPYFDSNPSNNVVLRATILPIFYVERSVDQTLFVTDLEKQHLFLEPLRFFPC